MKITENKLRSIIRNVIKESFQNSANVSETLYTILDKMGLLYSDVTADLEEFDFENLVYQQDLFIEEMSAFLINYFQGIDPQDCPEYQEELTNGYKTQLFAEKIAKQVLQTVLPRHMNKKKKSFDKKTGTPNDFDELGPYSLK
jgi:hypothetical protein